METVFYTAENYDKKMNLKVSTKTHGMDGTHPYNVRGSIKARCLNSKLKRYNDYGGRGIGICEKWLRFEGFYEDMGDFSNEVQVDRIDNNAGYCKENCRLVSASVNSANRSRPRKTYSRGVYFINGRYRSVMRVNGKNYHLGYFDTEELAYQEYCKNALEWWGNRSIDGK